MRPRTSIDSACGKQAAITQHKLPVYDLVREELVDQLKVIRL